MQTATAYVIAIWNLFIAAPVHVAVKQGLIPERKL
jgi:hypothetical protein